MSELLERIGGRDETGLPGWASDLRRDGRERFRAHGLPHKRLEDWKYTPLVGLEKRLDAPTAAKEGQPGLDIDGAPRLDFAGGRLGALPDVLPPGLHEGCTVLPLADALALDAGPWRGLAEALDTEGPSRAMAALNNASLGQGVAIHVEDGVDAGALVLRWQDGAPGASAAEDTALDNDLLDNARVLLVLGEGARLDLVEHATVGGALNLVMQARLGPGSRLRHARLQDDGADSWLITRTEVEQAADSRFEQASLDLGTGLARHDLVARLAEPGAVCIAHGAYLPTDSAHVDHHLDVRHEAVGCCSEQTFRGVLHDRGRAVFNGRVHVLPGADDSEAHQSNQNLLLSRDAEVDTKPELIIEADEVVASHGATVGQLDETALFYLRSRGIPDRQARQMLTGAFCRSVVEAIGNEAARAAFGERLETALERRA